jgi:Flp pilus assembly protein TadG
MTVHSLRRRPARRAAVRLRRALAAARGDTGSATAETVIIIPVLLLLVFGGIEFATAEQASHAAQAAASQALAIARAQDGTAAAGQAQAADVLGQEGGGLTGRVITVTRTGSWARVTVTGTVQGIIPGLHLTIRATVAGPVEEWTNAP